MDCKKNILYPVLFLSLFFSACKKEDTSDNNDYQTLGTAAHELLAAAPYSKLQIEIQYMPGYAPDTVSVNSLVNFLQQYLNKPNGIEFYMKQIPSAGKEVLSLTEAVSIEKQYRTIFTGGSIIGAHILITDGHYTTPEIYGTSYWNTSFCVFGETVKNNSDGPGEVSRADLMAAVLEHEFGHLLGLVNQGSSMQSDHVDPAHGPHCINPDCLMFYGIENAVFPGASGAPPPLDDHCIADLKANGGK